MECNIVHMLDEVEKFEIIKLSERLSALNELKLGEENFIIENYKLEQILQKIAQDETKVKQEIKDWWGKKQIKYRLNNTTPIGLK